MVMPSKYGLAGSNHEKDDAMPPAPDIRAKTGVMQQSDAAMADKILAPASFPDFDFLYWSFFYL